MHMSMQPRLPVYHDLFARKRLRISSKVRLLPSALLRATVYMFDSAVLVFAAARQTSETVSTSVLSMQSGHLLMEGSAVVGGLAWLV